MYRRFKALPALSAGNLSSVAETCLCGEVISHGFQMNCKHFVALLDKSLLDDN